jgi:hypothetical protein
LQRDSRATGANTEPEKKKRSLFWAK